MSFTIFQTEKTPVQAIKREAEKVENLTSFQIGQSMVLVKNWPFFHLFIFGNIGQENVFYDILERKNAFSKGLTHGFGPKMAISSTFFVKEIWGRKMSFTIFQNERTPFQAIKTRSKKYRKIEIFSKGFVPGFGEKLAILPCFHFWRYRPEKCLLQYSRTKKRLSGL